MRSSRGRQAVVLGGCRLLLRLAQRSKRAARQTSERLYQDRCPHGEGKDSGIRGHAGLDFPSHFLGSPPLSDCCWVRPEEAQGKSADRSGNAASGTTRRSRLITGLVLGIGLLVGALMGRGSVWAWSGVAVALVTVVGGAVARNLVWVTGRLDGDVLWLYGVHPAFAHEVATLAPKDLGTRGSSSRWVAVFLIAAVIVLGVILILMFSR